MGSECVGVRGLVGQRTVRKEADDFHEFRRFTHSHSCPIIQSAAHTPLSD